MRRRALSGSGVGFTLRGGAGEPLVVSLSRPLTREFCLVATRAAVSTADAAGSTGIIFDSSRVPDGDNVEGQRLFACLLPATGLRKDLPVAGVVSPERPVHAELDRAAQALGYTHRQFHTIEAARAWIESLPGAGEQRADRPEASAG